MTSSNAVRLVALVIVGILALGCQATVVPATPTVPTTGTPTTPTSAPLVTSPATPTTSPTMPPLVIHRLAAGQSAEAMMRGRLIALTGATCLRDAFVEWDPDLLGKKLEALATPPDRPDGLLADPRFYLGADIDDAVASFGATEAWVGSPTGAWILRSAYENGTADGALIGIQVLHVTLKDGRTAYGRVGDSVTACPNASPVPSCACSSPPTASPKSMIEDDTTGAAPPDGPH